MFTACSHGLGKSNALLELEPKSRLLHMENSLYAVQVLFIVAHAGAKVSLALFVRRLFNNSKRLNAVLCNGLVAITAAWGVISLIVLSAGCSTNKSPTGGNFETCPGTVSIVRQQPLYQILTLGVANTMGSRNMP